MWLVLFAVYATSFNVRKLPISPPNNNPKSITATPITDKPTGKSIGNSNSNSLAQLAGRVIDTLAFDTAPPDKIKKYSTYGAVASSVLSAALFLTPLKHVVWFTTIPYTLYSWYVRSLPPPTNATMDISLTDILSQKVPSQKDTPGAYGDAYGNSLGIIVRDALHVNTAWDVVWEPLFFFSVVLYILYIVCAGISVSKSCGGVVGYSALAGGAVLGAVFFVSFFQVFGNMKRADVVHKRLLQRKIMYVCRSQGIFFRRPITDAAGFVVDDWECDEMVKDLGSRIVYLDVLYNTLKIAPFNLVRDAWRALVSSGWFWGKIAVLCVLFGLVVFANAFGVVKRICVNKIA